MRAGVPALLLTVLLASGAAAAMQLHPVDEAASVPDFFTFRARLQVAVARHDLEAVIAALDPRIKNSFGGDDGVDAFRRLWKPEAPDTHLWSELAAVLALGGSFDSRGRFIAPYVYSRWPDDVDAFTHVAVVGSRVRVRATAAADAEVLATLDDAIVPLAAGARGEREGWRAVRLQDGRVGLVAEHLLRSPISYRAIFEKSGGRWRIVTLLAGD